MKCKKYRQARIILIKTKRGKGLLVYLDSVGVWTIGVGHTGKVDGKEIAKGMIITPAQSISLLLSALAWAESAINGNVKVPLTQNQYDALCSFVFNVGRTAFVNSTLLKKLNAKDYAGAADQFLQWKRAGTIADMLLPRRKGERELFKT